MDLQRRVCLPASEKSVSAPYGNRVSGRQRLIAGGGQALEILQADQPQPLHTISEDDKRRNAPDAELSRQIAMMIDIYDRKINPSIILVRQFSKNWVLGAAWPTPGGIEIDQDHSGAQSPFQGFCGRYIAHANVLVRQ
jgi:hypothetical protein